MSLEIYIAHGLTLKMSDHSTPPPDVVSFQMPSFQVALWLIGYLASVVLCFFLFQVGIRWLVQCMHGFRNTQTDPEKTRRRVRGPPPDRKLCVAMQDLYPHSVVNNYDLRKKKERAARMLKEGGDTSLKNSDVIGQILQRQDFTIL